MTDDDTWLGRVLSGRYQIVSLIGRGGMAGVYRAHDTRLDRFVAVKIFPPGAAHDDARRRSEVDMLARLNHPNLVTLYDANLAPPGSDAPSYLVMECVEGPDLRSLLADDSMRGKLAAVVAADIADALAAVHALGAVHRDLKPANILLHPSGLPSPAHRAKLADFGIAHLVGAEPLTTAGVVIGTAAYLSPEQANGVEAGPEADLYSLGLVVLECLTGARAYPGTMVEAISARAAHDPVIPADLPVGWGSLLRQMTARDPKARPPAVDVAVGARSMSSDLDGWSTSGSSDSDATGATAVLPGATAVMPDATAVTLPPTADVTDATGVMLPPTELLAPEDVPAVEPIPKRRSRRGPLALAGAIIAVALIGGGLVAGLLFQHPPGTAIPSRSATSSPVATTAPVENSPRAPSQNVAPGAGTTEPAPAPVVTPTTEPAPVVTPTPTEPSTSPTAPAPTPSVTSNGNNGGGN